MTVPLSSGGAAAVQARLLRRKGRLEDARHSFAAAISQSPRNPDLLVEAAVVEGELGNLKGAERLLTKALKLDPRHADAYFNLGQVAREEETLERAERMFRKALECDPRYGEAAYGLGEALYVQGKAAEALPWLDQALAQAPGDVEILHVRALTLDHLGRIPEALKAYREVLRQNPSHINGNLNLALLTAQSGDPLESLRLLNGVEASGGLGPENYHVAAKVLNVLGENERSLDYTRKAIEAGVSVADVTNTRANILVDFGDFEAAEKELRKVLALHKDSSHAYYRLAVINRLEPQAESTLQRLAKDQTLTAVSRANACFALYHLRDRSGRHEAAFEALSEANRLKGGQTPFDIRRHREQMKRIMAIYSREFIEAHRGDGFDGEGAIFVAGMPRSGTTLTEQILAAHPEVYGGGESMDVARVVRTPEWPLGADLADPQTRLQQGRDIHHNIFRLAEGKRFATDKTPANLAFFGAIATVLPKARLIYVRRQPGDNALSLYEQSFLRGLGYSYDLAQIGLVYREHLKLMDHWLNTCRLPIHTVEYDRMVADPEPHIRAMLEFAGLPFSPSCLSPERVDRAVRTSSVWQVRQPISAKSVGRWRRYERQMQPFVLALEDRA